MSSVRNAFATRRARYPLEQGTKPHTVGAALDDSPAGLAAWILEKFRTWSDCDDDLESKFSKDQLIDNLMVYWVTKTATSAARIYFENRLTRAGSRSADRGTHGHRRVPGRDHRDDPRLGGPQLQRGPLDGDATRRPLRGVRGTRVVPRRRHRVLPGSTSPNGMRGSAGPLVASAVCPTRSPSPCPTARPARTPSG